MTREQLIDSLTRKALLAQLHKTRIDLGLLRNHVRRAWVRHHLGFRRYVAP